MATLDVALKSARAYLGDTRGVTWTDTMLIPLAQEAHREFVSELELNGVPVTKTVSAVQTINAGVLVFTLPTGFIKPIDLHERAVGGGDADFDLMNEVRFLPDVTRDTKLIYWTWQTGAIKFVGATTNREVRARYTASITVPALRTDDLGFPDMEQFIGARTAALAKSSVGRDNDAAALDTIANTRMARLIRIHVKGQQSLPVTRIPFRRKGFWVVR